MTQEFQGCLLLSLAVVDIPSVPQRCLGPQRYLWNVRIEMFRGAKPSSAAVLAFASSSSRHWASH